MDYIPFTMSSASSSLETETEESKRIKRLEEQVAELKETIDNHSTLLYAYGIGMGMYLMNKNKEN